MKWYDAGEVDLSAIKKIKVAGKDLCLVKDKGKIYALGAKCPHAGADLSQGWCADGKLICPFHRYSYDLNTGRGSDGQNDFINTYPVRTEDRRIYVGIISFWEEIKNTFK